MSNRISVVIDVAVDKANRGIQSFRKSVSEADGAVGKFKAGSSAAFASLKANAGTAAIAAGAALVGFGVKAVNAASDLQESTNAVNKSFGEAASGVLEIGENAAESFGLSEAAFNQAAVSFSSFAETIAGEGGDVAAVVGDLSTRAADFASVVNIDVAEAATVFRSGLSGETEPLKKFGINLSAASVEAFALAKGLVKSKSEMTEAVKVQARYALLMELTSDFAGDFAETSDGLANSTRILSAKVTDLSARIGDDLTPTVEGAVGLMIALLDTVEAINNISSTPIPGLATREEFEEQAGWVERLAVEHGVLDDATRASADATRINAERTRDYNKAAVDAARAAEASAAAEEEATAAAEERAEALDDLLESINATREGEEALLNATLESIDSSLAYRNQVADTSAALAAANEVLASAEQGTDEYAQAARDAEGAALDQAAAAVRLAEDQAAANGETLTAEQKTRIYRDELASLAGQLNGDAAWAIAMHIQRLNAIPRSITTQITQKFGSLGSADYTQPGFGSTPRGATGGIVTRPTLALIGEAGPEAVVPLNKTPGSSPLPSAGGGSGVTIINNYPAGVRPDDVENAQRRYRNIQGTL